MSKEPRRLPKHTPGPWKHAHGFITDSDDVILAHVDRRCGTDATVQANAELIARAPELLARVEELTAQCDDKETRLLAAARRIATLEVENKAQHDRIKLLEDKYHKKADTASKFAECGASLTARVAELEQTIAAKDKRFDAFVEGYEDLIQRERDASTADNARLVEKLAKHREYLLDHKAVIEDKRERLRAYRADNASLRELLQTYKHQLDARWREGTRVDSYARGYQDGLEAAEVIFDDVFKDAIEKGE